MCWFALILTIESGKFALIKQLLDAFRVLYQ